MECNFANISLFDDNQENDTSSSNLKEFELGKEYALELEVDFQIMYNPDNRFGIYSVHNIEDDLYISVKGVFHEPLKIGTVYRFKGAMEMYKGDYQLNSTQAFEKLPISKEGITNYLKMLPGINDVRSEIIYETFGDKTLEIIKTNPTEISSRIKGIGKKSVLQWQSEIIKRANVENIMLKLFEFGLTPSQSSKIFAEYGDKCISIINSNPYILADSIRGFDYKSCDRLAFNIGVEPTSPARIQAGFLHVLSAATTKGNCFLSMDELIEDTKNLLQIKIGEIEMKRFLKNQNGTSNFTYSVGKVSFLVSYDDLNAAYMNYSQAYGYAARQSSLLVVSDSNDISPELLNLQQSGKVEIKTFNLKDENEEIVKQTNVYLKDLYNSEIYVHEKLLHLERHKEVIKWPIETVLNDYCSTNNLTLEIKQREGIIEASSTLGGIFPVAGSAGTGKTFCLKLLLEMNKRMYSFLHKEEPIVLFMAPTGKASKVATKSAKLECTTIHRALEYSPADRGFTFNEDNPFEADIIILDETTMVDIELACHLLKAIEIGTKVVFLGDIKQLAAVGPGNFFYDVLRSNCFKTVVLDVVKRQSEDSDIIKHANLIIDGKMIENGPNKNAFFINKNSIEGTTKSIISSYKRLLELYELEEVQLLLPQRKGPLGTYYLNYLLQESFNSFYCESLNLEPSEHTISKYTGEMSYSDVDGKHQINFDLHLKVGDKVIHTQNQYKAEWLSLNEESDSKDIDTLDNLDESNDENDHYVPVGYKPNGQYGITNGETGIIVAIRKVTKMDSSTKMPKSCIEIIVKYDEGFIAYENAESLEHAYAMTIHKSQGSQYKAVIMCISQCHSPFLLTNNLIYTGSTRAQQFMVTIGQSDTLNKAIQTFKVDKRNTTLCEFLVNSFELAG